PLGVQTARPGPRRPPSNRRCRRRHRTRAALRARPHRRAWEGGRPANAEDAEEPSILSEPRFFPLAHPPSSPGAPEPRRRALRSFGASFLEAASALRHRVFRLLIMLQLIPTTGMWTQ